MAVEPGSLAAGPLVVDLGGPALGVELIEQLQLGALSPPSGVRLQALDLGPVGTGAGDSHADVVVVESVEVGVLVLRHPEIDANEVDTAKRRLVQRFEMDHVRGSPCSGAFCL